MQIINNTAADKKDIAKATTTNLALKDYVDQILTVTDIITYEKENSNGTNHIYTVKTNEGWMMSNSDTVKDVIDTVLCSYTPDEIHAGIDVKVKTAKSSKGRDFYFLEIL